MTLAVVSWLWTQPGGRARYTAAHVNALRRMVARHLAQPHRFLCVTSERAGFDPGVELVDDPADFDDLRSPEGGTMPSCYRRLRLFHPDAGRWLGASRFLALDLDVVATGPLDPLVDRPGPVVLYRDPLRPDQVNGSLVVLTAGAAPGVWTGFDPRTGPAAARAAGYRGSDQAWLSYCLPTAPRIDPGDGVYRLQEARRWATASERREARDFSWASQILGERRRRTSMGQGERMLMDHPCAQCGSAVHGKPSTRESRRFCSMPCYMAHRRSRMDEKVSSDARECSRCKATKSLADFTSLPSNNGLGLHGWCNDCRRVDAVARRRDPVRVARQKQRYENDIAYRASRLWTNTAKRCAAKGVRFDLQKGWLVERLLRGTCELSGVPFDFKISNSRAGARSPSIDRIRAGGAYTASNCRMICFALNTAISDFGLEAFLPVVLGLADRHRAIERALTTAHADVEAMRESRCVDPEVLHRPMTI